MKSFQPEETSDLTVKGIDSDVLEALKLRAVAERFPDRSAMIRMELTKLAQPYIPLLAARKKSEPKGGK